MLSRRTFLAASAGSALAAAGPVRHILPTASHNRIRVKISLFQQQSRPPVLRVGTRTTTGRRNDSHGLFWSFDLAGLSPATPYELELRDAAGKPLIDPWKLRTLPHPDEKTGRFRLLVYTCAGGHDGVRIPDTDKPYWVSLGNRRKMLAAGLARHPDAVLSIGDQVYWDLRFGRASGRLPMGASEWAQREVGVFRRDIPVIGSPNEEVLLRAVTPQIADLYGTLFRSVPVFFIQDDHDYFENDEAIPPGSEPHGVSLPPDAFMLDLARATQRLYLPGFLPDPTRPADLPGAGEAFGTIRFGRAAEILVYDCRRFLSLTGSYAGFVPANAERWITARMKESPAGHVVNVPSSPVAWSAGKWGEWYPDLLEQNGSLGTATPKYMWQAGWKLQHDRLLRAASAMNRIPLFLSGDLHALGHAAITRNGADDLRRNPVHSVLSGPISTGPRGWPSSARGTPPLVATGIELARDLDPLENNGFTIADFLPDRIEFQMFRWKMDRPEAELERMEPFHRFVISRTV